jgi:hypothetical protein
MVLPAGPGGLLVHSHDDFGIHAHPVAGDLRPDAESVSHALAHGHDHARDHHHEHGNPVGADSFPADGLIADVGDFGGTVLPGADAPAADDGDAGVRPPAPTADGVASASDADPALRTAAAPADREDRPARSRHALDCCVKFLI